MKLSIFVLSVLLMRACGDINPHDFSNCPDDGRSCTVDVYGYLPGDTVKTCQHIVIPCDDFDACTIDTCETECVYKLVECDDGLACSTDFCINGHCLSQPINCDDGRNCTADTCIALDAFTPLCIYNAIPNCVDTCYDDGDPCTIDTVINGELTCNFPMECFDNDVCTNDFCNGGTCIFMTINCDDGDSCTVEQCIPSYGCDYVDTCNSSLKETEFAEVLDLAYFNVVPNPTTSQVKINFVVIYKQRVKISFFDNEGKELKTIFDGMVNANHPYTIDYQFDVASGLYFYRMITESGDNYTRKILVN